VDFNAPVCFVNDNRELATRGGARIGGPAFGVVQRVKAERPVKLPSTWLDHPWRRRPLPPTFC
jgi:hypothetical protein